MGFFVRKGKTNREGAFFIYFWLVRLVEKGGDKKKPAKKEKEGNRGYKEETSKMAEDILLLVLFGSGQRKRRAILDFLKIINFHEFYFHYYLFKKLVVVIWNFKFLLGLSFIWVNFGYRLENIIR